MTEPYLVTGSYVVQREHALQDSPLDRALELMEGTALRFSLDAISDEKVRANYLKKHKTYVTADVGRCESWEDHRSRGRAVQP